MVNRYPKGVYYVNNVMNNDNELVLGKLALAMAYVPWQRWEQPYDGAVALERGTIFPGLDKPFLGEEALPNGR